MSCDMWKKLLALPKLKQLRLATKTLASPKTAYCRSHVGKSKSNKRMQQVFRKNKKHSTSKPGSGENPRGCIGWIPANCFQRPTRTSMKSPPVEGSIHVHRHAWILKWCWTSRPWLETCSSQGSYKKTFPFARLRASCSTSMEVEGWQRAAWPGLGWFRFLWNNFHLCPTGVPSAEFIASKPRRPRKKRHAAQAAPWLSETFFCFFLGGHPYRTLVNIHEAFRDYPSVVTIPNKRSTVLNQIHLHGNFVSSLTQASWRSTDVKLTFRFNFPQSQLNPNEWWRTCQRWQCNSLVVRNQLTSFSPTQNIFWVCQQLTSASFSQCFSKETRQQSLSTSLQARFEACPSCCKRPTYACWHVPMLDFAWVLWQKSWILKFGPAAAWMLSSASWCSFVLIRVCRLRPLPCIAESSKNT